MSTDSDLDTAKPITSEPQDNVLESVLSSMTSFCSQANFRKIHINIIRKNKNVFERDFIEIHNLQYCFSGEIHVSQRLDCKNFFTIHRSFGYKGFECRVLP